LDSNETLLLLLANDQDLKDLIPVVGERLLVKKLMKTGLWITDINVCLYMLAIFIFNTYL
jgi:hypothetical protein